MDLSLLLLDISIENVESFHYLIWERLQLLAGSSALLGRLGGGDAKDWSRVVVALRGDFGDARVAVRVEDASGFAETPRSRL